MQIAIPTDNIAFQIGETAQVHSGGYLQVNHERISPYGDITCVLEVTPAVHCIKRICAFPVHDQPNSACNAVFRRRRTLFAGQR
jgi:hypothetical protein